jgi:putative two-component system response regulator
MTMLDSAGEWPKASILVVDDSPSSLSLMFGLLKDRFTVKGANNGENALRVARGGTPPDLILLDVVMPGLSGHEVCQALKADDATRDIPVIFLTSLSEAAEEFRGLGMGAIDYITKPVNPAIFLSRIKTQLENKAARDFLKNRNAVLEHEVGRRTREIRDAEDATIVILASLVETRDNETGNHIRRTQHYIRALAKKLQNHPRFAACLSDHQIDILFKSAPLHDIGKVAIPDRILLKPGKLMPEEFEIMKAHTTLGHKALEDAEQKLGMKVEFLACAKEIAISHQEKWNGSGYPGQLAGDEIPVSGRLMAVADVYDALRSDRVYKRGIGHEDAAAIIVEGKGSHFDPDMVEAFIAITDEFRAIADLYTN